MMFSPDLVLVDVEAAESILKALRSNERTKLVPSVAL